MIIYRLTLVNVILASHHSVQGILLEAALHTAAPSNRHFLASLCDDKLFQDICLTYGMLLQPLVTRGDWNSFNLIQPYSQGIWNVFNYQTSNVSRRVKSANSYKSNQSAATQDIIQGFTDGKYYKRLILAPTWHVYTINDEQCTGGCNITVEIKNSSEM